MKCDLHIHTSFSYDSKTLPKTIVETAFKRGVDCLAITDHGEIKGAIEAENYAKDKSILIIPGIEIKSREGDILGLNIRKIIPNGLSAKETIKRIKEEGGTVIIPHPFGRFCNFKGDLKSLLGEIDGIEVLNASIFGSGNKRALELVKKYNLPFTCGSDSHFFNFIGRTYLEIPGENLSIEEVLKKIKNRDAKVGGREAGFFEKIIQSNTRPTHVKTIKLFGWTFI